ALDRVGVLRAEVIREAPADTLEKRGLARPPGDRDDAVAIGPVGNLCLRLDFARPLVPEETKDEDAQVVFGEAGELGFRDDALFLAKLAEEPVDGDRMDLELLRELLEEGLGGDR